ncbi:MAG: hypothetical protein LDL26_11020 [Caenispirillum bisanense]|nr:hypothetical protein [Caenispirillum bisanense]MCA1974475.1 hypothetical protein [Caenispirillum sp.]
MASVLGITLFREKTTVHKFSFDTASEGGQAAMSIRSNRIAMVLKSADVNETVVVRGQNIPCTLRAAAMVYEVFSRNPFAFRNEAGTDWTAKWDQRLSSYERQFVPETWVSIHHNGQTLFSTNTSKQIDAIEALAQGGDVNEQIVRRVSQTLFGRDEEFVVQHDSQTAVVFTPFSSYHRAAILERRGGRTGSFAASVHHPPKPKKPVRYDTFIHFCADLIEAVNVRMFLERIKAMIEENRISGPPVTPAQVQGAMSRRKELVTFVNAFERANKVSYRPERPELF